MDGTILNKKYDLVKRIEALEEGGGYVLPVASADTLGGVKVGDNLSIEDGVLSGPNPYTPLNYSTTEQATGQKWIDGRDVYTRVFHYEDGLSLPNNTWVNSGTIADIDKCMSCVALSDDGTCIPVCAYYEQSVGLQFLSMRSLTITPTNFSLTYLKPAQTSKKKK